MPGRRLVTILLAATWLPAAFAEPLTVAAASNFTRPAHELAASFEARTGTPVRLVVGSTGKLYAQIVHGAPFDVFLAADAERPLRLVDDGLGIRRSRFTYATGSLVLWSRDARLDGADCRQVLETLGDRKLAIANPATAPYGKAAREFLEAEVLWERLRPQLVYGESIAQALQFAASGNAALGLIAGSQSIDERLPAATCRWDVPASSHAPIEQQAVLLRRAANKTTAREFLDFLRSPQAARIIRAHGYTVSQ
jgi:molybdate transport system substrate-binding protein